MEKLEKILEKIKKDGDVRFPKMSEIMFPTEIDEDKGYSIILRSGTVTYTDKERSYIVEEKSIEKLKDAKINFEIGSKNLKKDLIKNLS